ncbi:swi5-like zinc finger protein [Actinomortierella wolfii]|nr:swi5-like zinc finger protein [Actinomortierella wolfii]
MSESEMCDSSTLNVRYRKQRHTPNTARANSDQKAVATLTNNTTPPPPPLSSKSSTTKASPSEVSDEDRILALKAEIALLEREEQEIIKTLHGNGTPKEILAQHVKKLHQYNEIKDVGQLLLGKCAEFEGTTIRRQYEIFGLDPDD